MTSPAVDAIIVGSGASATIAAFPLLEGACRVLMLDVGDRDERDAPVPAAAFADLRRTDPHQHRYLLGDDFEGIDLGRTGPIAQVTPPRQYIFRGAPERLRTDAGDFAALESHALGGLAEAWGAGAFPFTDEELRRAGLDPATMSDCYEAVAKRIGVSGQVDDLAIWCGRLGAVQPPLELDSNARCLFERYRRNRRTFIESGFRLGRPFLAVLSRPLGGRAPNPGFALDFLANPGNSVFRPSLCLPDLLSFPGFTYRRGVLVTRFVETEGIVRVEGVDLCNDSKVWFESARLLVAAGTLGTARIVIRSLAKYDVELPLVCNEHVYIPCLHPATFGLSPDARSHSLAQLTFMFDPTSDQQHLVQGQLFSFAGLPLARLLKESPLPYRESIRIFQALSRSLVIAVVQHEDEASISKYCLLRRGGSERDDVLEIRYRRGVDEQRIHEDRERSITGFLRRLGCWPLRRAHPGSGSSVHYAGTLPMSRENRPLTTDADCRLRDTENVYLVDGSVLKYLPAKGPTLTLMANAHRVAGAMRDGLNRDGRSRTGA